MPERDVKIITFKERAERRQDESVGRLTQLVQIASVFSADQLDALIEVARAVRQLAGGDQADLRD